MKAFLLAGGFGTRLKPLTDTTPKCLVPINGVPLMEWWLRLLKKHGVTEVIVNTHYLYGQVRDYIQQYNQRDTGLRVIEFYEDTLLGSGGTINANRDFVEDGEDFFVCYANNLTDINLSEMMRKKKKKSGVLTMALFHTNKPSQCGIAELDSSGKIIEFIEKPEHPKSNLANAGIYVTNKNVFEVFPKAEFIDFGKDILPKLVDRMFGWSIDGYLIDIGTMDNYQRAQEEWKYNDYNKDTVSN